VVPLLDSDIFSIKKSVGDWNHQRKFSSCIETKVGKFGFFFFFFFFFFLLSLLFFSPSTLWTPFDYTLTMKLFAMCSILTCAFALFLATDAKLAAELATKVESAAKGAGQSAADAIAENVDTARDFIGEAVKQGVDRVCSMAVFGVPVCSAIGNVVVDKVVAKIGQGNGMFGDYQACWRSCQKSGGPKGSPGEPLTCKGACNALTGRNGATASDRASLYIEGCLQSTQLPEAVLGVYKRNPFWCV